MVLASRVARVLIIAGLGAGLAAGVGVGGGCSVKNPDFCCSTLDSCRAVGVDAVVTCGDPAAPFCDDDGAYGAPRACIADPTTPECSTADDCTSATLPRCDLDDDGGTCAGCAGEDDCTRFAATPHCEPTGGACVACVTSAQCTAAATPVCDADHACRACASDDECAAGVCAQAGTCPAASEIVYVDPAAPAGNVACTQAAPCPTIAAGLAAVTAARRYVKLAPGMYSEAVVIDGKTVELAGTGATITVPVGNQVFDVRNAATVTIGGLRIHQAVGRGMRCADSTVTLRGMLIDSNLGRALETSSCNVTVDRVRMLSNTAGGMYLMSGRATVRNSFIARNGNVNFGGGGVVAVDPIELVMEFDTIADNTVPTSSSMAAGFACSGALAATVTNNIIVGDAANQIDSNNCGPTYTLSTESVAGAGNVVGRATFRGATSGDYHLAAGSMGIDAADPAATVMVDIDGEARPAGGRSDMGADEVH